MLRDALAATGARVVVVRARDEGMGASLACGVAASGGRRRLDRRAGGHAVDRAATIVAVADAIRGGAEIAARAFAASAGIRWAFRASTGALLAALTGDEGARSADRGAAVGAAAGRGRRSRACCATSTSRPTSRSGAQVSAGEEQRDAGREAHDRAVTARSPNRRDTRRCSRLLRRRRLSRVRRPEVATRACAAQPGRTR